MGIIQEKTDAAFKKLEGGDFAGLVKDLVEIADRSVKYQHHRNCLDEAVNLNLERLRTSYVIKPKSHIRLVSCPKCRTEHSVQVLYDKKSKRVRLFQVE